ncbi:MAG TPA: sigma-70 family RNA polymerase sigma factor [Candidatus Acidoferrales bacterium]|nr:sigma-70 family RNA polymerase sigma factor [Candidatus Acidoferrales bacterium]
MALTVDPAAVESAKIDSAALERLIEVVWPEAYRIALAILRDRGLAEDAAQDACATIVRSLGALHNAATFASWTYRIAANAAVTIGRRRRAAESLDRAGASCAASIDAAEAVDLDNALAALPVVQRAAIVLHYYAGLKSSEIAAATGCPSSTVRFHIMLAKRALRKALAVERTASTLSDEVVTNAR